MYQSQPGNQRLQFHERNGRFVNASINLPVNVTGPGTLTENLNLEGNLASGNAAPGVTNFGLPTTTTSSTEQIPSSDFSLWENQSGNYVAIALTARYPTFQGTAQGNGLFFGGSSTETGKLTVEYTYTATPEPRGVYLTAIVGLAMGVAAFQRRKTARV